MELEVSLDLSWFLGFVGFAVGLGFTQVSTVQFVDEGLVGSLGEHALFLKDGQDTHRLFNEIDRVLQVHTEVNEFPFDAFLLVFFLLKDEHVVVEELLKTFVGVVDAKLLEAVELWINDF